jgi:hypothetical protein
MPLFVVSGFGRTTGRKRKGTFKAVDADGAITAASEAGIIVDVANVSRLPDRQPSEAQLSYAQNLGLSFPPDITFDQISDLLTRFLSHDRPCEERHLRLAKLYGVDCTSYVGKKNLFDRIWQLLLKPGREIDRAAFFAYRVERHLVHGGQDAPGCDGPDAPQIVSIGKALSSDPKILASIGQYNEGNKLIWFGTWKSPDGFVHQGGSENTIAFKTATDLLMLVLKS